MIYLKGRGAQLNTPNRFHRHRLSREFTEAVDDWTQDTQTLYIEQQAKSLVHKVDSPDVGMEYSMNPYAGCEHGCIYCYARNVHEYWDMSAGLDFERKIIVKINAPVLLRKFLQRPAWKGETITLSGNTDCYQPAEQRYRLTRKLLEICLNHHQPVSIITKNAYVVKDIDLLRRMAQHNLVSVMITITSLHEPLRRLMEPRTATAAQKLNAITQLSSAGVKTGIMIGPVIPGLNDHEMESLMRTASAHGALFSAYTFIRLNGALQILFHDWLHKNFPDRAAKVWKMIQESHGDKVNDSRWGLRMTGEGPYAEVIARQFQIWKKMYGLDKEKSSPPVEKTTGPDRQLSLF
ncbi:MAG: PA0069 family radical SAM protein [Chitinophagaceae bacterium]|nr:PA0069 family radical SAM protein [Chitinophagaceae bacterium]